MYKKGLVCIYDALCRGATEKCRCATKWACSEFMLLRHEIMLLCVLVLSMSFFFRDPLPERRVNTLKSRDLHKYA